MRRQLYWLVGSHKRFGKISLSQK